MENKIVGFLRLILKNGGASFVLTLVLAWLFREYFDIDPVVVMQLLQFMLWLAFYQSIFSLLRGEFFTTLQKWRDYRAGKNVAEDMDGKSIMDVTKDMGLTTVVNIVEKATDLRAKIAETKEGRKKSKLEKELLELEVELAKLEAEAV